MASYHVNPETMKPGRCDAQSPATCQFRKNDGEPVPHFASAADAQAHVEAVFNDAFGAVPAGRTRAAVQRTRTPSDPTKGARVHVFGDRPHGQVLSGSVSKLPHVDGTRVVLNGDANTLYTVRLRAVGGAQGTPTTYTPYLEDEDGDVVEPMPGRFQVYDGPDGEEFRTELRRLSAESRIAQAQADFSRVSGPVRDRLAKVMGNNWGAAHFTSERLGQGRTRLDFHGYEEQGTGRFTFTLEGNGEVGQSGDTNSPRARQVLRILQAMAKDGTDRELVRHSDALDRANQESESIQAQMFEKYGWVG